MRKILFAAVALAALAPMAANAEHPCLEVGYIYNWKALNDRTIIAEDYHHRKFRLSLIGVCNNLKYHEALEFRSPGAMELTCLARGDQVISHDFAMGGSRCSITDIEAYTPEMERADRAAAEAAKAERSGGY